MSADSEMINFLPGKLALLADVAAATDQPMELSQSLATVAYIAAAVLFILSLGGLSHQETSRRGNMLGIVGMILAIVATVYGYMSSDGYVPMVIAIVPAVVIGAVVANRVKMEGMPQLVAILHSFVGLAAVFVGISSHLEAGVHVGESGQLIHDIEIFIGVFIGAITFTGSVIAFLKLKGSMSGTPITIPGRHLLNLALIIVSVGLGVWFCRAESINAGMPPLLIMTAIALFSGCAHGRRDWRRGHAGRGVDVELLFRLGSRGSRVHAQESSANRHRRARGKQRCNPFIHHVQRHEPQLHQRDSGRIRHGRRISREYRRRHREGVFG